MQLTGSEPRVRHGRRPRDAASCFRIRPEANIGNVSAPCLLYPQKRTFGSTTWMPLCAKSGLVHCSKEALFDHVVSPSE
jgi:hypothetical protein